MIARGIKAELVNQILSPESDLLSQLAAMEQFFNPSGDDQPQEPVFPIGVASSNRKLPFWRQMSRMNLTVAQLTLLAAEGGSDLDAEMREIGRQLFLECLGRYDSSDVDGGELHHYFHLQSARLIKAVRRLSDLLGSMPLKAVTSLHIGDLEDQCWRAVVLPQVKD